MISELKGLHVLLILLGFFGITIAVNAAMSFYAIETFSGEDVSTPYMRGLAYNSTLRERAAEAALGWKVTIAAERSGKAGALLIVDVADRDGVPIRALDVAATLRRPTNAALDRTVVATAAGAGSYRVAVANLAAGQWDVIVRAKNDRGAVLEADRRVILP